MAFLKVFTIVFICRFGIEMAFVQHLKMKQPFVDQTRDVTLTDYMAWNGKDTSITSKKELQQKPCIQNENTDKQIFKWKTYLLSIHGYKEVMTSLAIYRNETCRFMKGYISLSLIGFSCVSNIHSYISDNSDKFILIFYFLILSGVEQNPGPGPINSGKERMRVRKSGLRYKKYLTNRSPFTDAPKELQDSIKSFTTLPVDKDNVSLNSIITTDADTCTNITKDSSSYCQTPTVTNKQIHAMECPEASSSTMTCISHEADITIEDLCDSNSDFSDIESAAYDLEDSESEQEVMETIDFDKEHVDQEDADKFPVYDGAQVSLGESLLAIMTFVKKHNLTGEAFSDLIELIQLHCKQVNLLPDSVYRLKQWFRHLKITPTRHFYCGQCLIHINVGCDKCPNTKCEKIFKSEHEKSFFVEVPLIEQLKKLFKQKEFRDILQKQFTKLKKSVASNTGTCTIITDIFDGLFYQATSQTKNLSASDITFTWNTDGVPLFKSSKTSMWPLYLAINELPYKLRRNPENLLLVGLWIGPKKPEMLTFLQPFINDLERLEKGIEIDLPSDEPCGQVNFSFRGFLISGTADLPAKCTVHNMVQFNGSYSCPYCKQSGQTAKSGKGICHVFPFDFDRPTGPKRTHLECLDLAESAMNSGKAELGIKGPCWFTKLGVYDFVKSNCIDYMHCVLLGVTKRLINLWFSKEYSGNPFNVSDKIEQVNAKITKLQPPLTISRSPRTLSELKYWKASEYRSFLLFYGPVVLMNVLSCQYYEHFLLLSGAIFILLKDCIEARELIQAENFLEYFVATFTGLYEPRFLTLNFHLLLHLPDNVRQLGPLWGYSCFPFEDANGFLMKLVKGTQSVHSQLVDSIAIMHGLPYLKQNCVVPDSKVYHYIHRLTMNGSKKMTELAPNVFALGGITEIRPENLSPDCYVALANFLCRPPSSMVKKFKRLKSQGTVIHSREYTRVKVRNSYTVSYKKADGTTGHGLINYYIAHDENVLAVVSELCPSITENFHFPFCEITDSYLMSHFSVFEKPDFCCHKVAISTDSIQQLCIFMEEGNYIYLCSPSNSVEKD